jgi:hypothetical protein
MSVRLGIPFLIQEGWLRHQEKDAKPPRGADGVVRTAEAFGMRSSGRFPFPTPSAPLKEASRLLLDVASTPSTSGGEWHAQFIHTFFDPAYRHYLDALLKQEGNCLTKGCVKYRNHRIREQAHLIYRGGRAGAIGVLELAGRFSAGDAGL